MEVKFYCEEVKKNDSRPSVFLAGPVDRDGTHEESWRKRAIETFKKFGFDNSVIYVPEFKNGTMAQYEALQPKSDFNPELAIWEREALEEVDCIMFWIPRDNKNMQGFTTNIEFGEWTARTPEKVILGFPDDAVRMGYIRYVYIEKCKRYPHRTLESTVATAIQRARHINENK